jgi:hypothetical protein
MKTKKKPLIAKRKLGSKAHDIAKKPRKIDRNFRQSADIGEDRGSVQSRLAGKRVTPRGSTKRR